MGIEGILWTSEKNKIIQEIDQIFDNFKTIIGDDGYFDRYGETLDDARINHTKRSLEILHKKIYPEKEIELEEISHLWIGINPPPNTTDIKTLYENFLVATNKYKWCTKYAFCVEANTKNGYRPHIHAMLLTKERPVRVINMFSKLFSLEKQSIECKAYHKGVLYGEHLDYIVGDKKDEKQEFVEKDNKERETLGIPFFVKTI